MEESMRKLLGVGLSEEDTEFYCMGMMHLLKQQLTARPPPPCLVLSAPHGVSVWGARQVPMLAMLAQASSRSRGANTGQNKAGTSVCRVRWLWAT